MGYRVISLVNGAVTSQFTLGSLHSLYFFIRITVFTRNAPARNNNSLGHVHEVFVFGQHIPSERVTKQGTSTVAAIENLLELALFCSCQERDGTRRLSKACHNAFGDSFFCSSLSFFSTAVSDAFGEDAASAASTSLLSGIGFFSL